MKKFTYLLFCLILGIGLATAQTTSVTGTVISSDDGEPIIGASVVVKGTTTGTVTDLDGNFTISNVPSSAKTLVISYVGMQQKEVDIQPNMHVVLDPTTQNLGEVVVTAMGISKEKKALGYAVQDVKGDELTQAASTNLASALQGKVSGVEIIQSSGMPGASSKITIRGSRSFTGDNTPLYVVDGMPIASTSDINTLNSVTGTDFANRAVDIDPNDIESINILKGQAASALYGMRASNGVVVITTKSGKGAKKGKPEVTINSNLAFDKYSTLPEFQTEYAQGTGRYSNGSYNYLYIPNASTSWGPKISELPNDPGYGGNTNNQWTQKDGMQNGKYYVPQRAAAGLDPWVTPQAYNNAKEFYNTGVNWSNSVNIAQGLENGHYSFSLGNTTSTGIVPSTGMDRYNVKLAAEVKLHNNWTTGFSGTFIASKITKQSAANDGVLATVYGAPPSYDLKGIPSHIEKDPYTQNTFRGTSGFDGAYWAIDNNKFTERTYRFFGSAFLNYSTRFNTTNHKLDVKYQLGDDSYSTNATDVWGYGHANGLGEIYDRTYTINEMNSLLTLVYNWHINDDFVFDAIIGNELVDRKRKYIEADGYNFNFSGWNHMQNASVFQNFEEYTKKRTIGNFGSVSLAYKNMLYLNVTGRQDIVSNMPRNNRSYFYPSVSLGWIFTELEPLKNNILTYGKLRASYAEVGMSDDYYNSYYKVPEYGGGFSSGTPILYPINGIVAYSPYYKVYDPSLKPQNTKSYEIGADFTFLNGLVSLSYTFSRQNVKDQIFAVPLAGSTGSEQMVTNGGSLHTNAHEVTLNVSPVQMKNFKWDLGFNFSKIDNYVDELAPGVESIMLGGFVEPQVRIGVGYKFPVIYGVSFDRTEDGKLIVDANGLPVAGEEKVIGNVAPDFRLGFTSAFEIYKFRLSAVFDWKQGGQMYSGTSTLLDYYGVSQASADARNAGSILFNGGDVVTEVLDDRGRRVGFKEGGKAIPSFKTNPSEVDAQDYYSRLNDISEASVYDNSFLKLREISLSYPVVEQKWLNVSVNVFARNIILWSEIDGIDPEISQGNNNMAGAFERFSLPGTSSYGFGVNIKF